MNFSMDLYRKYGVSAPRLNCFPPARDWSTRSMAQNGTQVPPVSLSGHDYALYLHLPFCESRCGFCACNISIARDQSYFGQYEKALVQEFETKLDHWELGHGNLTQMVVGGGTPTLYAPDVLARLAEYFTSSVGAKDEVEKWIEIEPRVTTERHFSALSAVGFKHAVFGVETYEPQVQESIKKKISQHLMSEQLRYAKSYGFETLQANVLVGLPKQTQVGLTHTLNVLMQQEINAVALFPYMHVPWIRPEKRSFSDEEVLSEEEKSDLFASASEYLSKNDFVDLGQGSFFHKEHPFVKLFFEKTLKRNYMGLGAQAASRVVGLGASAISILDTTLGQSPKELGRYFQWVESGELAFARWTQVNEKQYAIAQLIRQLWEKGALNIEGVAWSASEEKVVKRGLASLREDGLLEKEASQYLLTQTGRQFLHQICSLFYFPTLNIMNE